MTENTNQAEGMTVDSDRWLGDSGGQGQGQEIGLPRDARNDGQGPRGEGRGDAFLTALDEGWDGDAIDSGQLTIDNDGQGQGAVDSGQLTVDGEGQGQEPAAEETPPDGEVFTLKVLGKEYSLNRGEMEAAAQKGMNYDGLKADRDALRAKVAEMEAGSADLAALDRIAKEQGFEGRAGLMEQMEIGARTQKLMDEGFDEAAAARIAAAQAEAERYKYQAEQNAPPAQRQAEGREIVDAMTAELVELKRAYPDADIYDKDVEAVLLDGIRQGRTAVSAYQAHLLEKQNKELARLRQAEKNRTSTPGSVRGGKPQETDDFIKELMRE